MKKDKALGILGASFIFCTLGAVVDAIQGLGGAAVICLVMAIISGLGYVVASRL